MTATGTRPDTVLLGSAPNGDDTLYNLDFGGAESTAAPGMVAYPEEDWTQVVGGLEWRGRVATINAAVGAIDAAARANNRSFPPVVGAIDAAARANNRSFPPVVGAEPLTINLEAYVKFGGSPPVNVSTLVVELIERHSFYANRFPYPERIRFAVEFAFYEDYDASFRMPNGEPWNRGNARGSCLARFCWVTSLRRWWRRRCPLKCALATPARLISRLRPQRR